MIDQHFKKIRSFVRRESRITPKQKQALENLWPKYGLEPNTKISDFSEVFGRLAPLVLEIGFGHGSSFLQMAAENPQKNFLGIEVYRPGVGAVLSQLQEQQLTNVRIFMYDAVEVLSHCIPHQSLAEIFILFSDPWPKKRHQKRRLIQRDFLQLLTEKLMPQGMLFLATDWDDYAQQMMMQLSQTPGLKNFYGDGKYAPHHEFRPTTKYEKRAQRLGHNIWDLVFIKEVSYISDL